MQGMATALPAIDLASMDNTRPHPTRSNPKIALKSSCSRERRRDHAETSLSKMRGRAMLATKTRRILPDPHLSQLRLVPLAVQHMPQSLRRQGARQEQAAPQDRRSPSDRSRTSSRRSRPQHSPRRLRIRLQPHLAREINSSATPYPAKSSATLPAPAGPSSDRPAHDPAHPTPAEPANR
jgi:hypothetical protein